MKRKLAVLLGTLSLQAFAQSNVSLYGVVDVGFDSGSGNIASKKGIDSGRNMTSRLGVKGTEELGGGLKANFVLEGDLAADTGTGVTTPFAGWASTDNLTGSANGGFQFNRVATVGLSGNSWGSVTAGRNYTPTFLLDFAYDPFGENGVGANLITLTSAYYNPAGSVNHLRASNLVTYTAPGNLGGFNAMLSVAPSEVASNAALNQGGFTGGKIGYAQGPLTADFAWAKTAVAATGGLRTQSVGAGYDFGVVRPVFEYSRDKLGAAGANGVKSGYLVGATAPLGAGQLRMSYAKVKTSADNIASGNVSQLAFGYVYNLSKRTALYASYSRVSNDNYRNTSAGGNSFGYSVGGAVSTINGSVNGYDVGIRTMF